MVKEKREISLCQVKLGRRRCMSSHTLTCIVVDLHKLRFPWILSSEIPGYSYKVLMAAPFPVSLSLSVSLSLTHYHTLTHTLSLSFTHIHTHSLSRTHTHSLSLTRTHSLFHTRTLSYTLSLSLIHTHTLSLSLSLIVLCWLCSLSYFTFLNLSQLLALSFRISTPSSLNSPTILSPQQCAERLGTTRDQLPTGRGRSSNESVQDTRAHLAD